MSYEDDLIRRIRQEDAGVRSDAARKGHLLKMGIAGGLTALSLGLFACGALNGERGKAQVTHLQEEKRSGHKVDPRKSAQALAWSSGPELLALTVGGVSGVWFLYLLMRLRRFD